MSRSGTAGRCAHVSGALLGALTVLLLLSSVSLAARKDDLARWSTAGRAAMEDGLHDVAQKITEWMRDG